MSNSKPIDTVQLGPIRAAIWKNGGDHGPRFNFTLERRYKQGEE